MLRICNNFRPYLPIVAAQPLPDNHDQIHPTWVGPGCLSSGLHFGHMETNEKLDITIKLGQGMNFLSHPLEFCHILHQLYRPAKEGVGNWQSFRIQGNANMQSGCTQFHPLLW
mmetsp:Transcript_27527/g.46856  ORF Transcript_27527/g.46856 Transcript_27527/m.46856 type:complete len:113 (+) Transcript_27527:85-423(+)